MAWAYIHLSLWLKARRAGGRLKQSSARCSKSLDEFWAAKDLQKKVKACDRPRHITLAIRRPFDGQPILVYGLGVASSSRNHRKVLTLPEHVFAIKFGIAGTDFGCMDRRHELGSS